MTHCQSQVEQAFKYSIVEFLVFSRTDIVASDIHLNATFGVLQFNERSLTHYPARHHTSGYGYFARFCVIFKFRFYICRESIGYILCSGVRIDTHCTKLIQTIAPNNFLFT